MFAFCPVHDIFSRPRQPILRFTPQNPWRSCTRPTRLISYTSCACCLLVLVRLLESENASMWNRALALVKQIECMGQNVPGRGTDWPVSLHPEWVDMKSWSNKDKVMNTWRNRRKEKHHQIEIKWRQRLTPHHPKWQPAVTFEQPADFSLQCVYLCVWLSLWRYEYQWPY